MENDNVILRINKAREIVAANNFIKSGTVQGASKYSFIPIGQILCAVREAHAKAGVTVVFGTPQYDSEQFEERRVFEKVSGYDGKKTTWFAAVGHIHVTIYGSSVDDRIEMDIPFEAQDNSDKLTNKIITNAERCLYRVLYAIDEGDATDPEAFNEPMEEKELPKKEPKPKAAGKKDAFFGKEDTPEETEGKRNFMLEAFAANPEHPILKDMVRRLGPIAEWKPSTVRVVHERMQEAMQDE